MHGRNHEIMGLLIYELNIPTLVAAYIYTSSYELLDSTLKCNKASLWWPYARKISPINSSINHGKLISISSLLFSKSKKMFTTGTGRYKLSLGLSQITLAVTQI